MGRELHRSVLTNWVGLAIRIAVALVLLPFIVGRLGVERYGEYFFLASIFGYSELLDFGLRASILRYVGNLTASGDYARLNAILGSIFKYYGIVAAAVLGAGVLAWFFLPAEWYPSGASPRFAMYAGLFAGVAASSFFRIGWSSTLQACERYDLVNLIETGTFLLRAVVIFSFLAQGAGLAVLIAADMASVLISATASRIAVARVNPRIRPDYSGRERSHLGEVVTYSGWAFLNGIASQVRFRGPGLLFGGILTTTATGYYGVASRIQSYVFQLGTAMNAPFRSRATLIAGTLDQRALGEIVFRGTRFLAFVGFTLCSILFVFAEPLLSGWMGPEFGASARILQILLIGLAADILGLMLGGGSFATGRLRIYASTNVVEAVAIVVLVSVLARASGLEGAVYGITIPLVLNKALLQPVLLLRQFGIEWSAWLRRGVLRPVLCLAVALGPTWLLRGGVSPDESLLVTAGWMTLAGVAHLVAGWWIVLQPDERARGMAMGTRLIRRSGRA